MQFNTDGFILQAPKEYCPRTYIEQWEITSGFKSKLIALRLAVIKSNSIFLITSEGLFKGYGFNFVGSLKASSSFSIKKPSVIKDLLENTDLSSEEITKLD